MDTVGNVVDKGERWTNPVLLFFHMKIWDGRKINWSPFQVLADRVFSIVSCPQNVVGFSGWLVGFGFCRKVKKVYIDRKSVV